MAHVSELVDQLRGTLGRLELALSLVDDAIVWTDAGHIVQWCNASFDRLIDRPHIEILGARIEDVFPIEQGGVPVAATDSPFELADSRGTVGLFELRSRQIEMLVRRTARPEETIVASIRDVTERELASASNRALLARLEASNQELEAFAYSASHDLRAPLRSIDGFSQALLDDYGDQLPEKGKDYLRRVRAAAQRMAQIIDDMLRLSRVTRSELRRERVDLSALARSIRNELARSAPERRVEMTIANGLEAEADARLVRILMENLLDNAWKFTSGTPRARIEVGARDEAGEQTFFVRDNGAGFDMARADKLFVPFQRLHTASEFPGTGIGLATAQRIVHRHGGRIRAEGAVGRGATVWFTLGSASLDDDAEGQAGSA
jgi:signal transduction histidine kinase